MKLKEYASGFGWFGFAATAALVAFGTLAIRSAGGAREAVFHGMWIANLRTAAFAFVLYFALAAVDYRKILRWCAVPAYAGAVAMLAAVLLFGTEIYGGKRWLWFFQPSEISKLCVIVFFAGVFGSASGKMRGPAGFAAAVAFLALPVLLILEEPDLGTALVLVPAVVAMLLAAGVCRAALVATLVAASVVFAAVAGAVYEAEKPGVPEETKAKIMRFVPLKKHQVKRVRTFLFPESDPLGDGYTLRQAQIAIGSGGFSGKGLGKGETNHLRFLPPSVSMNDFIFCVWAEETGFVGSAALLALFSVVCFSALSAAFSAGDQCGRLLATGVAVMVFAHVYVNIGMSAGLVPITGVPLPFISSGRTFLVTVLAGLGLVQSVSIHKKKELE